MLLVAGMMRHILSMAGIESAGKSLLVGLGVGCFLITPWVTRTNTYAQRPMKLALLVGGYSVLGCGVIGLVLGRF
ncbi:Protein of unknown function [Pseudooceanicola antarcticus]|nr:Protein of unknown function [Pseudooceanicola antarcticus]